MQEATSSCSFGPKPALSRLMRNDWRPVFPYFYLPGTPDLQTPPPAVRPSLISRRLVCWRGKFSRPPCPRCKILDCCSLVRLHCLPSPLFRPTLDSIRSRESSKLRSLELKDGSARCQTNLSDWAFGPVNMGRIPSYAMAVVGERYVHLISLVTDG